MTDLNSIEPAYCFFHQKLMVYKHSTMEWQRDDIEYAIASYVDGMSPALYERLSEGKADYLREHSAFEKDLESAVSQLDSMRNAK